MKATFHTSKNELSDGSSTFDVYLSDEYGQTLVAEPVSREVAENMARSLNAVVARFLDCGSNQEANRLDYEIEKLVSFRNKKAA